MHPFFSQKQLLHLLTLLTSSRLLLLGKAQTSLALRSLNRSLAFVAFVENAKNRLFFMPGRIACLSTKSRTPEKPLSFAPESLQMSPTYIYTTEAKTCALRRLKTSR